MHSILIKLLTLEQTGNMNVHELFYLIGVILMFCSLSVGHSRRHVGGPTNWDIA